MTESLKTQKRMLAEVAAASGVIYRNSRSKIFEIGLPYDCGIKGSVTRFGKRKEAYIENISVNESLRKNGIGDRLLRMFTAHAKDLEATIIYGDVISVAMLKMRARVYGLPQLTFREIPKNYPNGLSSRITLPFEILVSEFTPLRVFANIRSLDCSDWERPTQTKQPTAQRTIYFRI